MAHRLFTSESVTEGHPDKMADQISDAILDDLLRQDPKSRVAVETMLTTGQVHVAGEVTTTGFADVMDLVRQTVIGIGYDSSTKGFDGESCGISVSIGKQSPDIAQGVDDAFEERAEGSADPLDRQGAGDQGLMFGFACDDTPELMPLPIHIAHRLAERLTEVRKDGTVPYLRPDGKTQVTIAYDENDRPVRIDTVVVSSQHARDVSLDNMLAPDVKRHVVDPVLDLVDLDSRDYRLLVNPTGRFEVGGPMGDAGTHRPQDHRRHLRRHGASRRWRVLRQGSRRRSTARPRTRCAGSPRTWWQRGSPRAARSRSPTRSARRTRSACSSRRSAPG